MTTPIIVGIGAVYLLIVNFKETGRIAEWIQITNNKPEVGSFLRSGLWVTFVFLGIAAFLPVSDMGRWGPLYFRLQPIFIMVFLVVGQALAAWIFFTRAAAFKPDLSINKSFIIAGAVFFSCILIIFLVIRFTGLGIGVGTQYWGKAGVPILHWQIGISTGLVLAGYYINGRIKKIHRPAWQLDLILFLVLWLAAFLVWQAIPIEVSRFTTQPYPPNYVSYPYSDAGDYVLSAESILVGNGYQYGYIDKPLHLTFIAVLSLLSGHDFSKLLILQVAFLALIPGLIYLITSKISNRYSGILAALLILFMQSNSLSAINRIQVSNAKMMMSEPLTSLMLMLTCLAVIAWWKNPKGTWGYPALAGAMMGLTGLVRLNVLVIIPFLAGVWVINSGLKVRKTWVSAMIFILFCILPQVPWMVRNQIKLNDPLASITSKTYGVIEKRRFRPVINESVEIPTPLNGAEGQKTVPSVIPEKAGIARLIEPMLHTGFHNLIAVSLVLPASKAHTGLDESIRQPYWDQEWDGTFTSGGEVIFAISLLLVIIGFSSGWKKKPPIALLPLLFLFPYLLSNTYSLVSGGRYIVPVDWILPVLYSIGLITLLSWIFPLTTELKVEHTGEHVPARLLPWFKPEVLVFIVIFISCIPASLSLSIPKKYSPTQSSDILQVLKENFSEYHSEIPFTEIDEFSSQEYSRIYQGIAVFPRWMKTGVGDTGGSGTAYSALPFDHLSFSLISRTKYPFDVVLPLNDQVPYFPNSTEVIVVGCQSEAYFDAVSVFILSPTPVVYTRPEIKKLECPLPKP